MLELSSGLLFPFDVSHISFGRKYFELVSAHAPNLLPEKYGNDEPLQGRFSLDSIEPILQASWQDMFLWKSKSSKTNGIWGMGKGVRHSSLFFYGKNRSINSSELKSLYKEMAVSFGQIDFGYVHALADPEWQSFMPFATDMLSPFNSGVTTVNLRKCIPNLSWATLFGRPYVELIGVDRILSSPAFKVERWGDNLVYVQVSPEISDVESAFSDFNDRRNAVKRHLGDHLFFKPNASQHDLNAPTFTFC